jgi:hypothetical protein
MARGPAVVTCAAALAVAAIAPGDADGRPGKVVRLEHSGTGRSPRFCQASIVSHGEPTIYCFGPHVAIGEEFIGVSEAQHGLVVRVSDVQPYRQCASATDATMIWIVKGQLLNSPASDEVYIGLIDGGVDPQRSRLISQMPPVSGRTGSLAVGIDRDGDGSADIAAEVYDCDEHGTLTTRAAKYRCYEIWTLAGPQWQRARLDIFHNECS